MVNSIVQSFPKVRLPLGLVHSDLCGKMNEKSLSVAEYFLSFIADKAHYAWVYFLKRKDQVFEKFVEWKTLVEIESSETLKILRTDNGGEFTSSEFEAYLKTEGVRHELTIPKTPEQNGNAECMNRFLVEAAHSMLSGYHLPPKFWAEGLSTAVYVRNRIATKALSHQRHGQVRNLLLPFSSIWLSLICMFIFLKMRGSPRNVFFLGMDLQTKVIICMILQKKKIILSCDVIFNEQKFGHDDIGQEAESQKYVYYDCFDDTSDSDSHTVEEGLAIEQKKVLQMPKKKFLPIMMLLLLCLHQDVRNERKESLIDMAFHAILLLLKNQFP